MTESTSRPTSAGSGAEIVSPVPLPELDTLTERQRGGRVCVWCAVTLSTTTAVDLGERVERGRGLRWFPRGCYVCVDLMTYRALLDHTQACTQCAAGLRRCPTETALTRTLRALRTVRR